MEIVLIGFNSPDGSLDSAAKSITASTPFIAPCKSSVGIVRRSAFIFKTLEYSFNVSTNRNLSITTISWFFLIRSWVRILPIYPPAQ